jgi:hypothetical protein
MAGDDGRCYLTQLCVTGFRRHPQALVADGHALVAGLPRGSMPATAVVMMRVLRRSAHTVLLVLILLAAVTLAAMVTYPFLGHMSHQVPLATVPARFEGHDWIETVEKQHVASLPNAPAGGEALPRNPRLRLENANP